MKRETRGRKTRLNRALTTRICALLAKGSSIKSACILCNVGERTYFDWQERGKTGEQPYETFFFAATRAREQHKARLIAVVMEAAHKDARHAEWLLERQFPREFAPYDRRPVPVEPSPPAPPPDLSKSIRFSCYGAPDVDLTQFMEMKAKLEAAGVKTDFPIVESTQPACLPLDHGEGLEPGEDVNGSPHFTP
jgi:hypothetical protein